MTKPKPNSLEFLLQSDVIEELLPTIGKEQWQTLYLSSNDVLSRLGIWCALLDGDAAVKAMDHDSWDLMIGDGKPGFSQSWSDGEKVTSYHRFGGSDSVRPLVLYRSFLGAFPEYVEVDEEFRLYHDLAEDKTRGLLLSFDTSGRETEVVRVTPDAVRARLKYLRQFQAGTRLHLAIYIDSVRYSHIALADVPTDDLEHVERDGIVRWRRDVAECKFKKDYETLSRLLYKVILPPPVREKAGIWPYENDDDQKAVSFFTGVDEDGNEVEHSSDPATLDNYFGANPGEPHYLTPVYFRREKIGTGK